MINIKISAPKVSLLSYERELIEKKMKELERYSRYFKRDLQLDINIEKSNASQTGDIYTAEGRLYIPGKDLNCQVEGKNIEDLAIRLRDNLKKLIIEHRKIRENFFKRATRKLKEKLIWRYLKH